MEEFDFRFGKIAQLYYEIANQKVPCQMDLLDEWFPGLMIITDSSDGNTKTPAEYQELSYVIHAVKYHGFLMRCGICKPSTACAIRRQMSETGELEDKLNVLFHPENYRYTYSGDDLDKRFPGVEWYCDGCGENLNDQDGFDDHLPEWKCRKCGYVNLLSIEEIYETDEDWQNGVRPTDPVRFAAAIAERRQELENERKPEERSV